MSSLVLIKEIVVDEVALEGLDGLTIESLWVRMADRMKWPMPLNNKVKETLWSFIVRQECFGFFRLPAPRPAIRTFVRGYRDTMEDLPDCPFAVYQRNEIDLDNGRLRGSCQDFASRELVIRSNLTQQSLQQVFEEYGDTLVIVGSQEIREAAIVPNTCHSNFLMTMQQYCLLERVGRARWNGETTMGKYPLEEGSLFHVRKPLLNLKMLCKQNYFERSIESTNSGLLLHLPRFYQVYKPVTIIMIEHIAETVKNQPNCLMEYSSVGALFEDTAIPLLRKLYKLPIFLQFFETDIRVPYRQMFPDASVAQYMMRQKKIEKSLRVIRLRNPDLDIHKMWLQELDEDTSDNEGHLDQTNVRLDISAMECAHQLLDAAGPNGMTQKSIGTKLGLTKLNARVLIRNMERLQYVSSYLQDVGRQRVKTFFLTKYKDELDQSIKEKISMSVIDEAAKSDIIKREEEEDYLGRPSTSMHGFSTSIDPIHSTPAEVLNVKLELDSESITANDLEAAFGSHDTPNTTTSKPVLADDLSLNAVVVEINELDAPIMSKRKKKSKPLTDENITVRIAERMNIIEKTVNQMGVLEDLTRVFNVVHEEERRMGYTDAMCRRSIHRLVSRMKTDQKLRLYQVKFTHKTAHTQLMFICKPDIDANSSLMLAMIEKEKFKFLLRLNNERARMKCLRTSIVKNDSGESSNTKKTIDAHKKPSQTEVEKVYKTKSPSAGYESVYGNSPKFHKIRSIHEFIFYLVYDYPSDAKLIKLEDAIPKWKLTEPLVNFDELASELPPIYSNEVSWKMFIPPISKYPPYVEDGWILFSDALLRLPISIYVSISNIFFEVPGLDEWLRHPIRKHYLLSYIPIHMQDQLLSARKHVFSLSEVTKRAACLGLLQFGPQRQKDKTQVFLYLNRNAILYDTVLSKPGSFFISEQDYEQETYYFATTDDISKYWSALHRICVNTLLGKRMVTNYVMLRWDLQPALIASYSNHTREEVLNNDVGMLPGDRRGAAGLDSSLFAHLCRNWTYKRSKAKVTRTFVPKNKPTRIVRAVQKRRQDKPNPSTSTATRTSKVVPIKRLVKRSTLNITVKLAVKRGRQQIYDDVDKQALRKMVKLRVDWSREEDNLLLLCRAAIQVINPSVRKINITMQQIRDILHWELKSYDKTSRACQRRIAYMLKSEAVARNVFLLVQDIMQNQQISQRFNTDLYNRLRNQIPEEQHFQHAYYTQYVELVYLLRSQLYSVRGGNQTKAPSINMPKTLAEFHERFHTKTETYTHDRLKYHAPKCWNDIEVTVMCGLIHSSCCCNRDKTSWNIQLYEIYKNYSDRVLGDAMSKVRDDQLISANKLTTASRKSVKTLPLSASPFHLSATYSFSMLTKIPVILLEEAQIWYNNMLDSVGTRKLQLRGVDGGCVLILAEQMFHKPDVRIDITVPNPVLVFDTTKCPENKVLLERINNRFRSIFDFVQNNNKQKISEANVVAQPSAKASTIATKPKKERCVTISLGDHQTKEYYLGAVERLMKMDDAMFHFFCVLNHLGERTKISRITIDGDHRCPFDCVLGKVSPVGIATEIIRQKAVYLPKICGENQMELKFIQGEFELSVWNVLSVFNVLVDKRFGTYENLNVKQEEVTDYGMLQIATDILQEDKNQNQINLDLGDDDAINEEPDESSSSVKDDFVDADIDEMMCGVKNGEKIYKMHDYFFLNPCRLTMVLERPDEVVRMDEIQKRDFLEQIVSDCVWSTKYLSEADFKVTLDNEPIAETERCASLSIMDFLMKKEEIGATGIELESCFPDRDLLIKGLAILQRLRVILKAGVVETTYIHGLFTKPWLVQTYHMKRLQRETLVPVPFQLIEVADKSTPSTSTGRKRQHSEIIDTEHPIDDQDSSPPEKKPLRPNRMTKLTIAKKSSLPEPSQISSKITFQVLIKPWIRVNGSLNRRVLDRWLGVLLMHCISNTGTTLDAIMRRFSLIVPTHVRDLIHYLERLNIVRLMAIRECDIPATLWSPYEPPKIVPATDLDTNQNVFLEVLPNAVTLLNLFIGEKQYKTEFI